MQRQLAIILLFIIFLYHSIHANEQYALFTAITNQTGKYHLMLQANLESLLQCCSGYYYPVILFDGVPEQYPVWLKILHNEKIISVFPHRLSWYDLIITRQRKKGSAAHFRMEIPLFMDRVLLRNPLVDSQYVFYTDIDVLFLKKPPVIKPPLLTLGPEIIKGRKDNNGVMFMNLTALQAGPLEEYIQYSKKNVNLSSQPLTLTMFRNNNLSTLLPDEYNWKPYWGLNSAAYILHTHGTKFISCMEHFIMYRFDKNHNFGKAAGMKCGNALQQKRYGELHRKMENIYQISYEEQMDSYIHYSMQFYAFLFQFKERLVNLTKSQNIAYLNISVG
jgi:hypothetical protein